MDFEDELFFFGDDAVELAEDAELALRLRVVTFDFEDFFFDLDEV